MDCEDEELFSITSSSSSSLEVVGTTTTTTTTTHNNNKRKLTGQSRKFIKEKETRHPNIRGVRAKRSGSNVGAEEVNNNNKKMVTRAQEDDVDSADSDESLSWSSGRMLFVDEEAMFNMPVLINSMAEGLMLTPPAMKKGFQWNDLEDDFQFITSLWKDN